MRAVVATAAAAAAAAEGICRQKASWGAAERVSAEPPKLSKSDADFVRDGLEFRDGSDVPIGELNELFSKVRPALAHKCWYAGQQALESLLKPKLLCRWASLGGTLRA